MLKSLFSLAVVVNVLILVSSETYEEYREEDSFAASSAQGTSSTRSDDTSTNSTSSSSSSAQSSASSSENTYSKARCKKNERWVECPDVLCVPFTCKQVGQSLPCPRIIPGRCPSKPACVCIEDYVKDKNGVCIPKKSCPSCRGDPNAQAGCGFLCGKRCDGEAVPKPCPCEINGCQCRKGFTYDRKQGKCVHPENCTKPCPKNEVYTSCANGGCRRWNCTQIDQPELCIDPIECFGGCTCKNDYLRARNGECIPQNECNESLCPKSNQVWDSCPVGCPPRKCGINDAAVSCAADLPCLPAGCRCQDGYYKNDDGDCVLFEDCPRCKKNERWVECPDALCVPFTCKQVGQSLPCPRIISGRCPSKPACVCIEGYVKDKNGVCIPKKSCPKCKENERFVECPDAFCTPSSCVQLGRSLLCPIAIPGHCPRKAGCICVEEYVRDSNVTCIPKKDCPSCRGDPNAQAGCGFLCGKRCDGETVPKPCPCEINGCQCRKGFTYDRNQGKCIHPENCTKPCPKNEVYTSCANGGCGRWNCTQIDQPELCIDPIECFGGCTCKNDYLRARNGECIPQNECNKSLCPKSNQVWDSCPLGCPPRKCGINDAAVSCVANQPCQPAGCRCQDGYYKNDDGECVLFEDCRPVTETPSSCSDQVEKLFIQGSAAWNGKILLESYKLTPSTSLIMSPFSLFVPMGELLAFSQGRTKYQFLNVFNLSSKDDLRCIFPSIINKIKAVQNVILNLANRLFITDMFPVKQNFLDTTSEMFDAVAESLDFSNGEASAKRINEWAANSTNNRIKQIASPDMFTQDTRLVLANAIYFLGNWTHQFNVDNTDDRDFNVDKDTIVKIPTMFQQNTFKYGNSEKLNSQLLCLPYKGNEVEFLIVLPNEIEGLSTVIDAAQDPDVFYEAYNNMSLEKARVYLPKIKTESELNMADLMQKAGITDVFNPAASNLTGILETYEPLHISAAKQKAFCLVNEKGTEAAAVNVITVGTTAALAPPPKIIDFDCNRPFAFYIMYSNIQLFSGTFVKQNEDSTE